MLTTESRLGDNEEIDFAAEHAGEQTAFRSLHM